MHAAPTVDLAVPAELAPFISEIVHHVSRFCEEARGGEPDFATRERELMELVGRLEARSIGSMLASLDPDAPFIQVGDRVYRRLEQRAECAYYTLRQDVVVNRHLYRRVDIRNGPTVVPLDLRAGIVDGRYTPAAAVGFARLAQTVPSREAVALCEALAVLPYSRSSHFRVGEQVGARWDAVREVAEPQLAAALDLPAEVAAVSFAVDRVSMPMAEPREPTAEDLAHGVMNPISVEFRMAYSAVWTAYDGEGEPLLAVRYAHVPTDGAAAIERSLSRDLDTVLSRRPDLTLVTLADGAPEMQSLLDRVVADRPVAARLVDYWHCVEHLGKAIGATGRFVDDRLSDWKADLLERDEAIDEVEPTLLEWKAEYVDAGEPVPKDLHDAITYIENNRERMRYATTHRANLPIGSGTVEATGKTIVEVRMKRAGCRWEEPGAQAILGLRALATSEPKRWNAAMSRVLASYRQHVSMLATREGLRA